MQDINKINGLVDSLNEIRKEISYIWTRINKLIKDIEMKGR